MKKRPVRAVVALTALAAIAPLSGCAALLSAQQTASYEYHAGDGSWTDLDGVKVRGLVFVQNPEGEAQAIYTLVNSSDESKTVSISAGTTELTHTLTAGEALEQNPSNPTREDEPELVEGLNAQPGDQVDVEVSVGSESAVVATQVLDSTLPYYEGAEPTTDPADLPTGATGEATETPGAESTEDAGAEGAEG